MPIDKGQLAILGRFSGIWGLKAFLVLFLVFYAMFALLILRQVELMTQKLVTPLSPFLKFIAIIHFGIALAILFLVIGTF